MIQPEIYDALIRRHAWGAGPRLNRKSGRDHKTDAVTMQATIDELRSAVRIGMAAVQPGLKIRIIEIKAKVVKFSLELQDGMTGLKTALIKCMMPLLRRQLFGSTATVAGFIVILVKYLP